MSGGRDILTKVQERYERLSADLEQGQIIVATAGASGAWYDIDQLQSHGDAVVFWAVDSDKCDVVVVQHYSELNVAFTIRSAHEGEQQKPLTIGFLPEGSSMDTGTLEGAGPSLT